MGKKEKLYPLYTTGGRIQARRHELGLSRSELYDKVYGNGKAGSDSSKDKVVLYWESGHTELNYDTLIAMCAELKCSSDYLLGLDECTTKTIQFIHDETGLSEDAIKELIFINKKLNTYDTGRILLFILSTLIENKDFSINLMSDINRCLSRLLFYTEKKEMIDQLHKESGGNLAKEIQLRQTKKYKNANNNLKDLEDLKDLEIYHTQNHFMRILNDFLSRRVEEISKDD